jgi:hypothetical protein
MGGGPSNSQTTSSGSASYPDEFKPLARTAVSQIQALQQHLPLFGFAAAQNIPTAGMSQFQKAGMSFIPQTLQNSAGLQTMQNMTPAYNQVGANAVGIGNQNPYAGALQALMSGGLGMGRQSFPGTPMPQPFQMKAPNVTPAPVNQTVAGPNTGNLVNTIASQTTPYIGTSLGDILPGFTIGPRG